MGKNKSKSDCECQCVETLAKQLKKNIGDLVIVYERNENVLVIGTIKKVIDDSVLVLDQNPSKTICFCGSTSTAGFTELFISICEITQFGVITEAEASEVRKKAECGCNSNVK